MTGSNYMSEDLNNKKQERFKKIAEQRTNKIVKTLDLLGNCANKSNYEYTDEQVRKIFNAIEKELKETKIKFESQQEKEKNKTFKL